MSVELTWSTDHRPLRDAEIRSAVEAALDHGGHPGRSVSVALVDDATLAELHERFLGDPSPTDVMSFPLGDDEGAWGEVVVSVDCALRVAAERDEDAGRELALYLVHGTLHLCGFDDCTDEERTRMRAAEALVLSGLGYA